MQTVGDWAIPMVIFVIVGYGLSQGVHVFDSFLQGARSGIGVAFRVLPALVALIVAVGIFRASGALDLITHLLGPITERIGLPREVVPLALLRPISGSGAMIIYNDILQAHGPDSLVGRIASVMQGSTETTFYTIAVYFGATSVRDVRHTLPSCVISDVVGVLASCMAVNLLLAG